jgi:hypothetical protein
VTLAGLAAVVAAGAVVLWSREDRITQENFDWIREGMSRAEVVGILGAPHDYSTGPLIQDPSESHTFHPTPIMDMDCEEGPVGWSKNDGGASVAQWRTDRLVISVFFLPSGEVFEKRCCHAVCAHQSLTDRALWRAKRQWRRWFPE